MSLVITDRSNLLTDELRQIAERRLLFALSRFDSRIERIELVLDDENGPRGGIDKACRLSVVLNHSPDVVISDKDANIMPCISRVADRAGRAVARTIARSKSYGRVRPKFADPSAAG